jgi:CHAT domain-containing protein/tetratricopeptide (TPR) repeat protein
VLDRGDAAEAEREEARFAALREFAGADTRPESMAVLGEHPELLSDEAEAMLVNAIGSWDDEADEAAVLRDALWIIRSSRTHGIALTYAVLEASARESAEPYPPYLVDSIQALMELSSRARDDSGLYPRVVSLIKGILHRLGDSGHAFHRASLLGLMGDAYGNSRTGDRSANLHRAIECYEEALGYEDAAAAPGQYAATQSSLGVAYRRLPTGDVAANTERAITHFEEALRVYPPDAPRYTYGEIQNNLGNAYLSTRGPNQAAHVEWAIGCFENALDVFEPATAPREYAQVQNGLGLALRRRQGSQPGDRIAYLQSARECFETALRVCPVEAAPLQYATTRYNLGAAHADLGRRSSDLPAQERSGHVRTAIEHFNEALRYWTIEESPWDHAMAKNSLGIALADLADIEGRTDLEAAATCFEDALRISVLAVEPSAHRRASANLGNLRFGASRWDEAHVAYASGAAEASRQAELGEAIDLVPNDAYCLARLGDVAAAVERLEGGRARVLADALARDGAALADARQEDREAFESARDRINSLEAEARSLAGDRSGTPLGFRFVALSDELAEARGRLSRVIATIRTYVAGFMTGGGTYAEIATTASRTRPLIYLVTTTKGSFALAVTDSGDPVDALVLWLDGFDAADLTRLRWADDHGGVAGGLLVALVKGDVERLGAALGRVLPVLRDRLVGPLVDWLAEEGFSEATLVPVGNLSLLALPAAAPDDFVFAIAPSAHALGAGRASLTGRAPVPSPSLLAVGDPEPVPDGAAPLVFARAEVQAIAPMFVGGARVLLGKAATRDAVQAGLERAVYLHLACHGSFDFDEPLVSGLWLASGGRLTLRDLLDGDFDLSSARLAVLSACESGITEFEQIPDEAVGLPAGLHQAGVPGVVSTLWAVDDVSTAVLVAEFYRLILADELDPARALHQAQVFLRTSTADQLDLAGWYERAFEASARSDQSLTDGASYFRAYPNVVPFGDPFFWAGFVFSGR